MSKTRVYFEGLDLSLKPSDFVQGFVPAAVFTIARKFLGIAVTREANRTRDQIGFGWEACPDAPGTYGPLLAAFAHSRETGEALPVSDEHCENSLFLYPAANHALRFWHDINHVMRQRDFSIVQEIDLALWHLDVIQRQDLPQGSIAWKLLEADTLGQTMCASTLGRFPVDQLAFDLDCVNFGIPDALVMEHERKGPLPYPPEVAIASVEAGSSQDPTDG